VPTTVIASAPAHLCVGLDKLMQKRQRIKKTAA